MAAETVVAKGSIAKASPEEVKTSKRRRKETEAGTSQNEGPAVKNDNNDDEKKANKAAEDQRVLEETAQAFCEQIMEYENDGLTVRIVQLLAKQSPAVQALLLSKS